MGFDASENFDGSGGVHEVITKDYVREDLLYIIVGMSFFLCGLFWVVALFFLM